MKSMEMELGGQKKMREREAVVYGIYLSKLLKLLENSSHVQVLLNSLAF